MIQPWYGNQLTGAWYSVPVSPRSIEIFPNQMRDLHAKGSALFETIPFPGRWVVKGITYEYEENAQ